MRDVFAAGVVAPLNGCFPGDVRIEQWDLRASKPATRSATNEAASRARAAALPSPEILLAAHAAGESWVAMAARLGCSTTTLRKTAFPEIRDAYNDSKRRVPEDPEDRRERDLQRLDALRDTCTGCGKQRGRGSVKRGPGVCATCKRDGAQTRRREMAALRTTMTDKAIAERYATTQAAVRQQMVIARRDGLAVPPPFRAVSSLR
jgi:hypothetical protein